MGGGIPYKGSNPITLGEQDIVIAAHTLLREALTIKNGIEPGLAEIFGYTKFDTGVIVPTSFVLGYTIPHNLGVAPKVIIIEGRSKPMMSSPRFNLLFWDTSMNQRNVARMSGSNASVSQNYNLFAISDTDVQVKNEYFVDGAEHLWLFMA